MAGACTRVFVEDKHLSDRAAEVEGDDSSLVMDADFQEMIDKVVPTTDDTTLPSFTLRVWIIGTFFCFVIGGTDHFFSIDLFGLWRRRTINTVFVFRSNTFSVTSYVAILLAYPMGNFLARVMPLVKFSLFGYEMDTNPGPFSIKEHVLEIYYDLDIGHWWGIAFLFCSATLGFGIAGMCRSFLIRPKAMIWPSILPSVTMFMAFHQGELHSQIEAENKASAAESGNNKEWSQLKRFGVWTFFPGFIATSLRYLSVLCWITPSGSLGQKLGSPTWGPGILSLTLDWTVAGSGPMSIPFWVAVNQLLSTIIFLWVPSPLAWQDNWFNQPATEMALNTTKPFKKDGEPFAGAMIIDKKTKTVVDSL
ncbi:OPT super [Blastocladiella emersonii ATCC 22665]|nr:OPT super [Blastocladiella emersonii ATCC 22665]